METIGTSGMTMLGRYRIDARIGEGAMAEVFRAHDTGIDRVVAIKALKAEYRRDPEIARRFLREATAAGTLNHANIATIYDVGETDGVAYIAMELVAGRPLDEVLKAQGRMPYERVLALGLQMAEALAYAHSRGIVHRDVKPSNILLSENGLTAKLLDFGVARIGETDQSQLVRTQVGQMIGTPRYMSPEQALGLTIDHRSDLFSLGIVLYEMITGKAAFAGSGLATLVLQIAQSQPDPVERSAADCPKGLRFVIEKLLAKKPEQRFATGEQLCQALRRELDAANAESQRRRGFALRVKLPLVLAATTALALAASVATVLDRQDHALEHMAVVSGSSITAFITSNAAVLAADNAGLPAAQQDWAPLQAFVDTAAHDTGVSRLVIADATGTVRAASDRGLIGRRYATPAGEAPVASADGSTVTSAADAEGFRFVRPIRYAGADFGKVDLLMRRTTLDAAMGTARGLLVALSAFVMLVVVLIGWLSASMIIRPIGRLRRALDDAAAGDLSFRISHDRSDEFGAAFDAFNRAAAALEPQLGVAAEPEPSLTATLVAPRAPPPEDPPMYMLRLFDEGDPIHPIDARMLREGLMRIGRDPTSDWAIPDPDREISRTHCVLDADRRGLRLRCSGANGVYDDATGARLPEDIDIPLDLPSTLRLGRFRLIAMPAPHEGMMGGGEMRTMVLTPPLGASTDVPTDWSDATPEPRVFEEGSLLEAFCEGAGLDASLLSGEEPTEIMRRAGAVYRQMVLGIGDLMTERDRARVRYHLSRTTIGGTGNNPFKWAPTQRLAIDLLLAGTSGFLSGPAALQASFQDIKRHLVATFAGLQASLRTAVDSFAPDALDAAIAGKGSLLKSKAALQVQEAADRHADLRRQLDHAEGGSLDDAFVAGYDAAEARADRPLP